MRPTRRPSRQVRQTRSEDHLPGHSDCTFPADAATEAPAARDVDDAARAPLVTAEGRLAATWAGNLAAARASVSSDSERLWSAYFKLRLNTASHSEPNVNQKPERPVL